MSKARNSLCEECVNQAPDWFCIDCDEIPLCADCVQTHSGKLRCLPHNLIPIGLSSHSIQAYKHRSRIFTSAKKTLLRNLTAIESCIKEVNDGFDQAVATLRTYQQWMVGHLDELKTRLHGEIIDALAEVENSLIEETPHLGCPFAREIREEHPDLSESFTYEVHPPDWAQVISTWIRMKFDASERLSRRYARDMVVTFDDSMHAFDWKTEKWRLVTQFDKVLSLDAGSSQVIVSDTEAFICGGAINQLLSFLIRDTTPIKLPNLPAPRISPGLISSPALNYVYIFGGRCNTCLRFDWISHSFQAIAAMHHARWRLNPCWSRGLVYICGGGSEYIEVYSQVLDVFSVLPITLPTPSAFSSGLAVLPNPTQLLLISTHHKTYFSLQNNFFTVQEFETGILQYFSKKKEEEKQVETWSVCAPLVMNQAVYYVNWDRQRVCTKVSLNDCQNPTFIHF